MSGSTVRDNLPADVQAALGQLDTILLLTKMTDIDVLKAAHDALVRFDSIGHILDPTAFTHGMDARRNDGRLLHAFLGFRKAIDEVAAEYERN